ncbi:hypothetical protein pb186bvf_006087 [Paramecium bursaria]
MFNVLNNRKIQQQLFENKFLLQSRKVIQKDQTGYFKHISTFQTIILFLQVFIFLEKSFLALNIIQLIKMLEDSPQKKVKLNENALSSLKNHTIVVSDTGKIKDIEKYKPQDATTNPSLILEAAKLPEYKYLIESAIKDGIEVYKESKKPQQALPKRAKAKKPIKEIPIEEEKPFVFKELNHKEQQEVIGHITDQLSVNFGLEILKLIPGYISTEVDARLSYDKTSTQDKAKQIIKLYEKAGISKDRILIKIAATWEGIQAAKALKKDGINCNMTLIFNLHQAIACAQAGVKLISPFVGRILDWFKEKHPDQDFSSQNHPGYHKHDTIIMAASLRLVEEAEELSGVDRMTIPIKLLDELQHLEGKSLDSKLQDGIPSEKTLVDEKVFRWELNQDAMATEKLTSGIKKFAEDLDKLEVLVRQLLED